jgi:hypothetical protein
VGFVHEAVTAVRVDVESVLPTLRRYMFLPSSVPT